jgi:hypothetical protein
MKIIARSDGTVEINGIEKDINVYASAIGKPKDGHYEIYYNCKEALIEALQDMGAEYIEEHEDEVLLEGAGNQLRSEKAHIILKKKEIGTTNDIGFKKQDGSYNPIVTDLDRTQGFGLNILSRRSGGTGKLDLLYARRAILKTIENEYGHKLIDCKVIENTEITMNVSV